MIIGAGGVSVLTGRRVVRVDPVKQEAVLHDGTVIRQEVGNHLIILALEPQSTEVSGIPGGENDEKQSKFSLVHGTCSNPI
jgi:hypothetical protein